MQAFTIWRRTQHCGDMAPDERNFEGREFGDKLTELPGWYAPPLGRLLIVYEADQPVGCAALYDLGNGLCEAERIFVADLIRGQRFGRALVERLLLEAKGAGDRRICLGTSLQENDALRLCQRAGFQQVRPCQKEHGTADQKPGLPVLFERDLRSAL